MTDKSIELPFITWQKYPTWHIAAAIDPTNVAFYFALHTKQLNTYRALQRFVRKGALSENARNTLLLTAAKGE